MSGPMYGKIYESLLQAIKEGRYQVGDRVPSEKELAEAYQVSRITSKKALGMLVDEGLLVRKPGKGSFVADPADRKKAAAAPFARASANRRSEAERLLIGLIITDFAESYGTGLIYGMEDAAREHGGFLVIRRSFGNPAYEEEAIRGMLDIGVDGLIILPAQGEYFNAEILKLVIDQFPLVLVDRHLKGISAGSISTDNVAGAKRGIDYLFELGHRHIALVSPPPMDTTAVEDRIEGFVQAHAEKGVVVDRELWLDHITSTLPSAFTEENRAKDIETIKQHLARHPEITAVFAIEHYIALLVEEAAGQLNRRIPADLSIICFDCPEYNGKYPFTHLRQSQAEMGRLALESVLRLRDGEGIPNKLILDADLILGASTAKAAAVPSQT